MVYRTSETLSYSTLCWYTLVTSVYSVSYTCFPVIKYLSNSLWVRTFVCLPRLPVSLSTVSSSSIHLATNNKMPFIFWGLEMTQQLRTLAVLMWPGSSSQHLHGWTHLLLQFQGSNTLLYPPWEPALLWCTRIHANIYAHKKTLKNSILFHVWINKYSIKEFLFIHHFNFYLFIIKCVYVGSEGTCSRGQKTGQFYPFNFMWILRFELR